MLAAFAAMVCISDFITNFTIQPQQRTSSPPSNTLSSVETDAYYSTDSRHLQTGSDCFHCFDDCTDVAPPVSCNGYSCAVITSSCESTLCGICPIDCTQNPNGNCQYLAESLPCSVYFSTCICKRCATQCTPNPNGNCVSYGTTVPCSKYADICIKKKGTCFSGETNVLTPNGKKGMKDLAVGDVVWTGKNFQPVYAFGHRDPNIISTFLLLKSQVTSDSLHEVYDSPLEVTHNHLLFVEGYSHPIPASLVKVGDKLDTGSAAADQSLTVSEITTVVRQGIFAPMTVDGTVVVNSIKCSAYVTLTYNDASMKLNGGSIRFPFSHHFTGHVWMTPMRWFCSLFNCSNELLNSEGMPLWVKIAYNLHEYGQQKHVLIQIIMLLVFLFPLMILSSVELFLWYPFVSFILLGAALIWILTKKLSTTYKKGKIH